MTRCIIQTPDGSQLRAVPFWVRRPSYRSVGAQPAPSQVLIVFDKGPASRLWVSIIGHDRATDQRHTLLLRKFPTHTATGGRASGVATNPWLLVPIPEHWNDFTLTVTLLGAGSSISEPLSFKAGGIALEHSNADPGNTADCYISLRPPVPGEPSLAPGLSLAIPADSQLFCRFRTRWHSDGGTPHHRPSQLSAPDDNGIILSVEGRNTDSGAAWIVVEPERPDSHAPNLMRDTVWHFRRNLTVSIVPVLALDRQQQVFQAHSVPLRFFFQPTANRLQLLHPLTNPAPGDIIALVPTFPLIPVFYLRRIPGQTLERHQSATDHSNEIWGAVHFFELDTDLQPIAINSSFQMKDIAGGAGTPTPLKPNLSDDARGTIQKLLHHILSQSQDLRRGATGIDAGTFELLSSAFRWSKQELHDIIVWSPSRNSVRTLDEFLLLSLMLSELELQIRRDFSSDPQFADEIFQYLFKGTAAMIAESPFVFLNDPVIALAEHNREIVSVAAEQPPHPQSLPIDVDRRLLGLLLQTVVRTGGLDLRPGECRHWLGLASPEDRQNLLSLLLSENQPTSDDIAALIVRHFLNAPLTLPASDTQVMLEDFFGIVANVTNLDAVAYAVRWAAWENGVSDDVRPILPHLFRAMETSRAKTLLDLDSIAKFVRAIDGVSLMTHVDRIVANAPNPHLTMHPPEHYDRHEIAGIRAEIRERLLTTEDPDFSVGTETLDGIPLGALALILAYTDNVAAEPSSPGASADGYAHDQPQRKSGSSPEPPTEDSPALENEIQTGRSVLAGLQQESVRKSRLGAYAMDEIDQAANDLVARSAADGSPLPKANAEALAAVNVLNGLKRDIERSVKDAISASDNMIKLQKNNQNTKINRENYRILENKYQDFRKNNLENLLRFSNSFIIQLPEKMSDIDNDLASLEQLNQIIDEQMPTADSTIQTISRSDWIGICSNSKNNSIISRPINRDSDSI